MPCRPVKKLDKSRLKISSMRDFSGDVSRDTVGLQKWSNVQNARRMQEIQKNLHDRYGIRYTEVSEQMKTLRANSNHLSNSIAKSQKDITELRQFISDCDNLEEQQRQNERDLKELQHYQKEIDTYLGKKHEDI